VECAFGDDLVSTAGGDRNETLDPKFIKMMTHQGTERLGAYPQLVNQSYLLGRSQSLADAPSLPAGWTGRAMIHAKSGTAAKPIEDPHAGFVTYNPTERTIAVVLRGSGGVDQDGAPDSKADWAVNLDATHVNPITGEPVGPEEKKFVHGGFYRKFKSMQAQIREAVDEAMKQMPPGSAPPTIQIMGHSQGAALSQLVALDLASPGKLGDPPGSAVLPKSPRVALPAVRAWLLSAPRAFSVEMAGEYNDVLKKNTLTQNLQTDPVPLGAALLNQLPAWVSGHFAATLEKLKALGKDDLAHELELEAAATQGYGEVGTIVYQNVGKTLVAGTTLALQRLEKKDGFDPKKVALQDLNLIGLMLERGESPEAIQTVLLHKLIGRMCRVSLNHLRGTAAHVEQAVAVPGLPGEEWQRHHDQMLSEGSKTGAIAGDEGLQAQGVEGLAESNLADWIDLSESEDDLDEYKEQPQLEAATCAYQDQGKLARAFNTLVKLVKPIVSGVFSAASTVAVEGVVRPVAWAKCSGTFPSDAKMEDLAEWLKYLTQFMVGMSHLGTYTVHQGKDHVFFDPAMVSAEQTELLRRAFRVERQQALHPALVH
jgi:hypothetical protein